MESSRDNYLDGLAVLSRFDEEKTVFLVRDPRFLRPVVMKLFTEE